MDHNYSRATKPTIAMMDHLAGPSFSVIAWTIIQLWSLMVHHDNLVIIAVTIAMRFTIVPAEA